MKIYSEIAGSQVETEIPIIVNTGKDIFYKKVREFLDCIIKNKPSVVPTSQIIINQEIIDAICKSSDLGHEIQIDLMRVIETQSKITLANWAMDYAQTNILPIYEKYYKGDNRPQSAIISARKWLKGEVKFNEVKDTILNSCHQAAREADANPAAQASARAIGQASATIHVATHSLGIAFYGIAAIAYDKYGTEKTAEFYDKIATEICFDMERTLKAVSVENEPNKVKINWHCK